MSDAHHVVILGGGFGGLHAAQALARAPVQVTLVDRRNFHLFQPLLYQVATGALSPANIAAPLRGVLKRQANTRVMLAEATDIDPARRRVLLSDGELAYDSLIVATGASHDYFGNDQWAKLAPGLKTIEDATEIRRRILLAFEIAEREADPKRREAWCTFVVVGAGPTGVELAGALAEIAHRTLRENFRAINPADSRIVLIEGAERVLPPYPPDLSAKARSRLERLGVEVMTGAMVTSIEPGKVTLRRGGETVQLAAKTVVWAAGVRASPLGRALASRTGAATDRAGRVRVEPDLSVSGHPEILVIGDLASFSHQTGEPLPAVASVAIQQAKYAADSIRRRLRGESAPPFRYRDLGKMATIGRGAAVADFGWLRFNGYLAWLAWLGLHLVLLVEFSNRLLVVMQWAWNYFTWNRNARLITGESPLPLAERVAESTPVAGSMEIAGPTEVAGSTAEPTGRVPRAGSR